MPKRIRKEKKHSRRKEEEVEQLTHKDMADTKSDLADLLEEVAQLLIDQRRWTEEQD